MIDLQTRNRKEAELELERLKSSQIQCERQFETRERGHRQRIKCLEEQISTLRDQLSREIRNRQHFLTHSAAADEEIKNLHTILSDSLGATSLTSGCSMIQQQQQHQQRTLTASSIMTGGGEQHLDPILMEMEARRLSETMSNYVHELPVRHKSPSRRCLSPNKIKFRY